MEVSLGTSCNAEIKLRQDNITFATSTETFDWGISSSYAAQFAKESPETLEKCFWFLVTRVRFCDIARAESRQP
jgi:hypothetical protein